jgi:hypothetical protein
VLLLHARAPDLVGELVKAVGALLHRDAVDLACRGEAAEAAAAATAEAHATAATSVGQVWGVLHRNGHSKCHEKRA